MLRSKLAPGTRCALEHGGAAPVIVAEDADLDDVLPLLVKGGFYHAGQVCVSVQRVFAHRAVFNYVSERLAASAGGLRVGDPLREETDIGPLIRRRETDRVAAWVDEAVGAGAHLLQGGEQLSPSFYAPTVLANPPEQIAVSQKEIFGPVICLYQYDDLDDAIRRANALPFAFHAAVMSRDINTAMYAYKHLAASAVMINDHTGLSRRLDAVRRAASIGIRGRRHPAYLPRHAVREDDGAAIEPNLIDAKTTHKHAHSASIEVTSCASVSICCLLSVCSSQLV